MDRKKGGKKQGPGGRAGPSRQPSQPPQTSGQGRGRGRDGEGRGRGGGGRGRGRGGGDQQPQQQSDQRPGDQFTERPSSQQSFGRPESRQSMEGYQQQQPAGAWGRGRGGPSSGPHQSPPDLLQQPQVMQGHPQQQPAWGRAFGRGQPLGGLPQDPSGLQQQQPQQMHPQQQQMHPQQIHLQQQQMNPQQIQQQQRQVHPQQMQQQPQQQPQPQETTQQKKQAAKQNQQQKKPQQKGDTPDVQSTSKTLQKTQLVPKINLQRTLGTKGRKIPIETNHLRLELGSLKQAIHYDVAIDPDKPKKMLRPVMAKFQMAHYPNRYPAFDGVKNLYASKPLPFDTKTSQVEIEEEDGRKKLFTVTVKFANTVDLTVLQSYLNETLTMEQVRALSIQEALQCVDIVLRSAPSMTFIPVGRSYFSEPRNMTYLGEGMGMYVGFTLSSILGWKPFVNVDVAHKAFPLGLSIVDLCRKFFNKDMGQLERREIEVLEKHIKGLKVEYYVPPNKGSKRIYKVNGFERSARDSVFETDNGVKLSVMQYFEREKKYRLQYPDFPTLWVGSVQRKQKMLFPAELCTVVKDQVTNRKMTENQTREMVKRAATDTKVRKSNIKQAIEKANFNRSPAVNEFGFKVHENFEQIEARVLDPPSLDYGDKPVRPKKGVWRNMRFKNPAVLSKWTILCLDRGRLDLDGFAHGLRNLGNGNCGMVISEPTPFKFLQSNNPQLKMNLHKEFETFRKEGYDLVIVVLPNYPEIVYSLVKQVAELTTGLLTQCVRSRTMMKMNSSTLGNILLKINAKRNGVNHGLKTVPPCLRYPCMIMGADVTHPSPDSRGIPSVAAVTASHSPTAFTYNICWRLQPPKMEIIGDLENITVEHLMFFYKETKNKPQHIIFYRDGVSDGQFAEVLSVELQAIRRACLRVQKDGTYKPFITFLVVQKRHHTRFFPCRDADSEDRNCNVPAGTCVDTVITDFRAQDFYLVSHASIQGVAKPTKYRTLWDDKDMHEDELEALTYYLCHMFARCTRSVSYPAPTYYAHLAAARAKVYCAEKSLNLDDLDREQKKMIIKEEIVKGVPMFFV